MAADPAAERFRVEISLKLDPDAAESVRRLVRATGESYDEIFRNALDLYGAVNSGCSEPKSSEPGSDVAERPVSRARTHKVSLSHDQGGIVAEVMERLRFLEELFQGYVGGDRTLGDRFRKARERWEFDRDAAGPFLVVSEEHLRLILTAKLQELLGRAERLAEGYQGLKWRYLGRFKKGWYWAREYKPDDPEHASAENLGEYIVRWTKDRRAEKS